MRFLPASRAVFAILMLAVGFVHGQEPSPADVYVPRTIPLPPIESCEAAPCLDLPGAETGDTSAEAPRKGGEPGRAMGLGMGPGPGYTATWYPTRSLSSPTTGEELGLVRQSLALGLPVWKHDAGMVMFSASVENSLFSTDAVLPDSHQLFPHELWNVRLGTNYLHKFDNGWTGMVGLNFGSASDQPFQSIEEMNLGFLSALTIPARNDRDAWQFMLMYLPLGDLNFPVPGVAYQWNPSETFHMSLGVPLSLTWMPAEDLTLSLSYMPLTTVRARATYRLGESLSIYGGFEMLQDSYLLADRENNSDHFLGFEDRLVTGVQWDLTKHAVLDVNAGYAFQRIYGVGKNAFSTLRDKIEISPGAFLSTSLHFRF